MIEKNKVNQIFIDLCEKCHDVDGLFISVSALRNGKVTQMHRIHTFPTIDLMRCVAFVERFVVAQLKSTVTDGAPVKQEIAN